MRQTYGRITTEQLGPKTGEVSMQQFSMQYDSEKFHQVSDSSRTETVTFNNRSPRQEFGTQDTFHTHSLKQQYDSNAQTGNHQIEFSENETYQEAFQNINQSLNEVKQSSQAEDEILKDMSQQSEKLSSAISFLRQFMFMHNINFDNTKFVEEQHENQRQIKQQLHKHSQQQQEQSIQTSSIQKSSISSLIPNERHRISEDESQIFNNKVTSKQQQMIQQQQQQLPTAYQIQSKMKQVVPPQRSKVVSPPKQQSKRMNTTNQSNSSFNISQQQHLNNSMNNNNPGTATGAAPTKLTGLLTSILQERQMKEKKSNINSKK